MGKLRCEKLHQNRGIARLVVILTVAALVLLAAALYPVIQRYRFRADALGCLAGLDTARREAEKRYGSMADTLGVLGFDLPGEAG